MCMVHATPARAYCIMVLNQKPPILQSRGRELDIPLLGILQAEIAADAYGDTSVWHPAFNELLTFAAGNMAIMQRELSRNDTWLYPVCDVIEGIADLFGAPVRKGFTPTYQSDYATTYKPHLEWDQEVDRMLDWINLHETEVPLAAALTKQVRANRFAIRTNRKTIHEVQVAHNKLRNYIGTQRRKLLNQRNMLRHGRPVIHGTDMTSLRRWLSQGYTLTECYVISQHVTESCDHFGPYSKGQCLQLWRQQLPNLPLTPADRHELAAILDLRPSKRSNSRRLKLFHQRLQKIMIGPDGLPLLREIWPEAQRVSSSGTQIWLTSLDKHLAELDNIEKEVKTWLKAFDASAIPEAPILIGKVYNILDAGLKAPPLPLAA